LEGGGVSTLGANLCNHESISPSAPVFAASAATRKEIEDAKQMNIKPVSPQKRVWRPQVTSDYKEPDCIPDELSDLEVLYKDFGKPLWANKKPLPPRDDLIAFDKEKHKEEFDSNINWGECPLDLREEISGIIKEFWDVFAEEGVRKNIRGIKFHVDTGSVTPV
jgi:hypothetical protein